MREHFRVIIVGGGMAGLETAVGINDPHICVLEAGTSRSARPVSVSEWCRPMTRDPDWWAPSANGSGAHFDRGFGLRRRLGGRSLCWHGVSLPMEIYSFDERWSAEAKEWVNNESHPFARYQSILKNLREISQDRTLPEYINAPILRSSAIKPFRSDGVYTPVDYLSSKNINIHLGRTVTFVEKDRGGFIVHVQNGLRRESIRSDIVIFAAGAACNANFCSQLTSQPYEARIYDHIVVGRSLISSENLKDRAKYSLQYRTLPEHQTRIFVSIGSYNQNATVDMWTMASDKMTFDARLRDGRVHVDAHSISTTYRCRCEELKAIIDIEFNRVLELLHLQGLSNLVAWAEKTDSHEATLALDEGRIPVGEAIPFEGFLGGSDHEHGSVPFGVIGQYGELSDVEGAFFVGPSCFPSLGGSNPTLPSLAQCRVTADRITAL